MGLGKFNLVLEQGSAKKPFHELTDDEVKQLGRRVMAKVKWRCRKFGTIPVIGSPRSPK